MRYLFREHEAEEVVGPSTELSVVVDELGEIMNRVDGKGKVFTERVRKTGVEVRMETLQGQVHGFLHVVAGQRVKDLLNSGDELFLAVTDATLYG
jgi:hypothetical protein